METRFMDGAGLLRRGDDQGLTSGALTFTIDGDGLLVATMSPRPGVNWALRTRLDDESNARARAEQRLFEACRVAMASENPLPEDDVTATEQARAQPLSGSVET
jgi:hypothetical protein